MLRNLIKSHAEEHTLAMYRHVILHTTSGDSVMGNTCPTPTHAHVELHPLGCMQPAISFCRSWDSLGRTDSSTNTLGTNQHGCYSNAV